MSLEHRDKWYGNTIEECVEIFPRELQSDAVGLWQIIPFGIDGFNLEGEELTDFTRRCIMALLEHGGRPVRGGKGTPYDWILQPQYGETNDEILDTIIDEWLASSNGEPKAAHWQDFENPANPGGIWFALPNGGNYSVGL